MARKPRRFDLSPDNFLAGVSSDLKADELGLFWLICLRIYSKGGPIPYDEQSFSTALNRTDLRIIKRASARLQQLDKITVTGSQVMAKGCATPLEEAANRLATATENGLKGGRPSNENKGINKPDGSGDEKLLPPSPPQPSNTSSLRSEEREAQPERKRKRGLPEVFPAQSDLAWARDHWLSKGRADLCSVIDDEVEKFRDHHSGKLTTSADWPASWRTWVRNAMKFNNGGFNGKRIGATEKRTATDQHLAGIAEAIGSVRDR